MAGNDDDVIVVELKNAISVEGPTGSLYSIVKSQKVSQLMHAYFINLDV